MLEAGGRRTGQPAERRWVLGGLVSSPRGQTLKNQSSGSRALLSVLTEPLGQEHRDGSFLTLRVTPSLYQSEISWCLWNICFTNNYTSSEIYKWVIISQTKKNLYAFLFPYKKRRQHRIHLVLKAILCSESALWDRSFHGQARRAPRSYSLLLQNGEQTLSSPQTWVCLRSPTGVHIVIPYNTRVVFSMPTRSPKGHLKPIPCRIASKRIIIISGGKINK